MKKLNNNKGITLISLVVVIGLMIIITSVLLYNITTSGKIRVLDNLNKDISLLKDKVDYYYAQYGALPILKDQYKNVDNLKGLDSNDNDKYYVIDLSLLDNISLTYGKAYETYKVSPNSSYVDLYVINEQSHNIYYVAGVDFDDKIYYTIQQENSKVSIYSNVCNHPILATGMTPIKLVGTEFVETESYDPDWYEYIDTSSIEGKENKSNWANAKTEDGSMWVWIPRYAYKITYKVASDKSQGGTIDIVFLKGTSNLDFNGNDVTSSTYVDAKGNKGAYIVHPAFKDGSKNNFANGEWDSEITGFWVAKFEAGYAGEAGKPDTAQDSNVELSVVMTDGNKEELTTYYGARKVGDKLKYPVFEPNRPSMNYLGISDAYNLAKSLTSYGNPYGLKNVDSHMLKNSEWGAVAYLTHSKYGRNGKEVTINNVSVNSESTVWAVTGYGGTSVSASQDVTRKLATLTVEGATGSWKTEQGQSASSTGNMSGIYDLSGGAWEFTTGYIATTTNTDNYNTYGGSLKGDSTRYKSKYAGVSEDNKQNYNETTNASRKGEAIWETSTLIANNVNSSWNTDYAGFLGSSYPFCRRGGYFGDTNGAGIFTFTNYGGNVGYATGFRAILIAE